MSGGGVLCADELGGGGGPPPPTPTCCADPVDTIVAASPSRLVDIDTTSTTDWPDGISVWVRSVEDFFILNRGPALVADGITVADPLVGGGQWRRRNVPSQTWLQQATWFINSATGDDENVGDVIGSPLATHRELERRAFGHGQLLRQDTTVEIAFPGLSTEGDRIKIDVKMELGTSLVYNGVADTPPIRSGTLTGATATDPTTQTQQLIEDTVGGPFTAEVGDRIRIVGGPRDGALAWIAADLDPGIPDTARTSAFAALVGPLPLIVRPLAGDSYVIEALPTILLESVRVSTGDSPVGPSPGSGVIFNGFVVGTSTAVVALPVPTGPFAFCTFIGCNISFFLGRDMFAVIALSRVSSGAFFKSDLTFLATLNLPVFAPPAAFWQNCKLAFGGEVLSQSTSLFERGSLFTAFSGFLGTSDCAVEFVNVGGEPSIAAGSTFDAPAAFGTPGDGMSISEDVTLLFRSFYFGDGNAGYGIRMTGKGWYQPDGPGAETFKPTVTGALGDTTIGGIDKAYAGGIPFFNASNGAQLTEMAETP